MGLNADFKEFCIPNTLKVLYLTPFVSNAPYSFRFIHL
jgi:hypothetical protein